MYCSGKSSTETMSRIILAVGAEVLVDHKNHDTLDNQRHNLRPASHAQNTYNQRTRRDNNLGMKGISVSVNDTWRVRLKQPNGKTVDRKFKSLDAAREFHIEMQRVHHKEFACAA